MKNQFKAIIVSAVAALLVASVLGQSAGPTGGGVQSGGAGGGAKAGARGALLSGKKLEMQVLSKITPALSAEQKSQIAKLDEKTTTALKALKEKAKTGDRAALKGEVQKIQTERREGLRTILTPAQQQSYMALMKEAREKMKKGKDGKGGGKSGSKIG